MIHPTVFVSHVAGSDGPETGDLASRISATRLVQALCKSPSCRFHAALLHVQAVHQLHQNDPKTATCDPAFYSLQRFVCTSLDEHGIFLFSSMLTCSLTEKWHKSKDCRPWLKSTRHFR